MTAIGRCYLVITWPAIRHLLEAVWRALGRGDGVLARQSRLLLPDDAVFPPARLPDARHGHRRSAVRRRVPGAISDAAGPRRRQGGDHHRLAGQARAVAPQEIARQPGPPNVSQLTALVASVAAAAGAARLPG